MGFATAPSTHCIFHPGPPPRPPACSSVARCINGRIRHALQELIDFYTSAVPCNSCCIQVHIVDFRYTTRSIPHNVGLECAPPTRSGGSNSQLARAFFNAYDFGAELNVNPKLATALHKQIDQVRIEAREGARSAMCDGDLRSGTPRHVREFKRDIPTTDK